MIFGDKFTFNGKSSDADFNSVLVSFDSSNGFETPEVGQKINLITVKIGDNPQNKIIDTKYDDVLKFKIGIAKQDGAKYTQIEIRNIYKWLTVNNYKKITIDNDKYCNVFFNAIPTNIVPQLVGDDIVGFEIEWECDNSYGYETLTNTYTISGNVTTVSFTNSTDDLLNNGIIRPKITVHKSGTGEWYITNKSITPNLKMDFSQLLSDETLMIDTQNFVLSSDVVNRNLYPYFNKKWLCLVSGENSLEISGASTVTITCDIPRKVGI